MAFLKTTRARGGGDILINLDHVLDLRPITKSDRRTRVSFVAYDDEVQTLNVNADFDKLAADWNQLEDEDTVQPLP